MDLDCTMISATSTWNRINHCLAQVEHGISRANPQSHFKSKRRLFFFSLLVFVLILLRVPLPSSVLSVEIKQRQFNGSTYFLPAYALLYPRRATVLLEGGRQTANQVSARHARRAFLIIENDGMTSELYVCIEL